MCLSTPSDSIKTVFVGVLSFQPTSFFCRRCFDRHGTIIFCPFLANAEILAASSGVRKVKIFCISSPTKTTVKKDGLSMLMLVWEEQFQNLKIRIKYTHTWPNSINQLNQSWHFDNTPWLQPVDIFNIGSVILTNSNLSLLSVSLLQLSHRMANLSDSLVFHSPRLAVHPLKIGLLKRKRSQPPIFRGELLVSGIRIRDHCRNWETTFLHTDSSYLQAFLEVLGTNRGGSRPAKWPRMIKCWDEKTWLPI